MRRAVVVPVAVLAGVLALSGGVAVLTATSSDQPDRSAAATSDAPRVEALASAAAATLRHPSVIGRAVPAGELPLDVEFQMDTRSGNSRQLARGTYPGTAPFETESRTIDGRTFVRVPGEIGIDGDIPVEGPGQDSSKPWVASSDSSELALASNPLAVLRPLAAADPTWRFLRATPADGGLRYTVRSPSLFAGLGLEVDLDVRGGEVVRLALRPDEPDCPGDDTTSAPVSVAADPVLLVSGSDRPVVVVPPPSKEVEPLSPSDARATSDNGLGSLCPAPDDLSPGPVPDLPAELPSDFPTDFPTDFPSAEGVFEVPAAGPSPSPS